MIDHLEIGLHSTNAYKGPKNYHWQRKKLFCGKINQL
jgi:hypothetical protein